MDQWINGTIKVSMQFPETRRLQGFTKKLLKTTSFGPMKGCSNSRPVEAGHGPWQKRPRPPQPP